MHPRPHVLLLATAVLAVLTTLSGCDDTTPPETTTQPQAPEIDVPRPDIRLGLLVHNPDTLWAQHQLAEARQAADKLRFELIALPIPDADAAHAAIDHLAAQGAGGLVISNPDNTIGYDLAQRARAANLKVLSTGHSLVGANGLPHGIPHIGFNDAKIGNIAGVVLDATMRARGWRSRHLDTTAVCLLTDTPSASAQARLQAAREALESARFPAQRIINAPQPKPGDAPGADAAAVLMRQHTDIRHWAVIGTSDRAVLGALRAFKDAGLATDAVIGIGTGGLHALKAFRHDTDTGLHASVLLSPGPHGYDAASAMYHWIAHGVEPQPHTVTPERLIDRRNYQEAAQEAGIELPAPPQPETEPAPAP